MILYHPISTRLAIDKYANRDVYVFNSHYFMWLKNGNGINWTTKDERDKFTFKEALKKTKHYHSNCIEYHFIDNIGEFDLKQYDSILDSPFIIFDKYSWKKSTSK